MAHSDPNCCAAFILPAKADIRTAPTGRRSASDTPADVIANALIVNDVGNEPRNPMRRIGSNLAALSAANTWSSDRPRGRPGVRATDAGVRNASELARPGSGQPE
jgi:hypothetical protein